MKLPILIEPEYRNALWCMQTLEGVYEHANRKKYEVILLDGRSYERVDYGALFGSDRRQLIVIGTALTWMPQTLAFFERIGVHIILVSFQPLDQFDHVSTVCMNHEAAMLTLREYLGQLGVQHVALYGMNPNSSADNIKVVDFLSCHMGDEKEAIFYNHGSLSACFEAFAPRAHLFDAVICANDIAAVSLMQRLKNLDIHVPGDLQLVSFGDTLLAQLVSPSITTASLDHYQLGQQAVAVHSFLNKQTEGVKLQLKVSSHIVARGSTCHVAPLALLPHSRSQREVRQVDFYDDAEVNDIAIVEHLMTLLDPIDTAILCDLLAGESYERIAEALHATEETVKYRVRRMVKRMHKESRSECIALITKYISRDALLQYARTQGMDRT